MSHSPPPESISVVLDPQIEFSRREIGGRTTMVARHGVTGKFFQFGPEEYHIARLLQEQTTVAELTVQIAADGVNWDVARVADFVSRLITAKLAITPGAAPPTPNVQPHWSQRLAGMLSLVISQRFPLINGDQIASRLERRFGVLFSRRGMLVWCVLVFTGFLIVQSPRIFRRAATVVRSRYLACAIGDVGGCQSGA